jgi:hypothetical protein
LPSAIWNLDWLNANSQRRYPLTGDSSGQDTTASVALPSNLLVELDLPVHAGNNVDPARFFIKTVGIYATGITVTVGYQPAAGSAVDVATSMIPRDTFAENTTYALGGVNDYADTVGKLVIGSLDGLDALPSGFFTFALADARVEPDCVRPIIRGVSALIVSSGGELSTRLYGDIELIAETNVQLTPVIVAGQDSQIRISAIQGEGLAEACVCDGEDAPAIRRINGVPPTPAGDFTILGNTCLSVTEITNGLKLADECSEPCCGCQDLEAITRDLERFGTQSTTLENFLNRLEAQVNTMNQIVLGSRINDKSCVSCE